MLYISLWFLCLGEDTCSGSFFSVILICPSPNITFELTHRWNFNSVLGDLRSILNFERVLVGKIRWLKKKDRISLSGCETFYSHNKFYVSLVSLMLLSFNWHVTLKIFSRKERVFYKKMALLITKKRCYPICCLKRFAQCYFCSIETWNAKRDIWS